MAARLSGSWSPSLAARSRLGSWLRIAVLELPELLARLQAKLLRELVPGHAVGLEGLGLTCRAVEGEHQLVSQALLERVPCDQRLELADELRVVSERQVGIDSLHKHREAHLLETRDLGLGKSLVGEIGERGPAPQPERLPQLVRRALRRSAGGLGRESLETRHVGLVRFEVKHVAARTRGHASGVEHLAQPRDLDLDVLRSLRRRRAAPDLIDELVGRDELVRVHQEDRQHGALLDAAERQRPVVLEHLERAKEPEVHGRLEVVAEVERGVGAASALGFVKKPGFTQSKASV